MPQQGPIHAGGICILDACGWMIILNRMRRYGPWILIAVLAIANSSCALAQLAGRTANNTVKGIGQAASAAGAAL